ncbi:MAG: DUF1016 family protein [Bacteroidales bacterium]|nr:DUF1016 family protein [Bacteroidales bacterium]
MAKDVFIVQYNESEYNEILLRSVAVIESARTELAVKAANTISSTYWEIGKILHEKKLEGRYGDSIVKRLSGDLKERYPQMGLSSRQLWNMKKFYLRYQSCDTKLLRAVAVLTWSKNLLLLNNHLGDDATLYYANECVSKGWSRDLLLNAIKMRMHETHSITPLPNNFADTLPTIQAQFANEVFRSTYNLGFLGVTDPILELELEARLVSRISRFLVELGKGFTFIGNQYELEYQGNTSRVDMLFFHRGLRALVAVDLKIGPFRPEYAGKMNYYLSLLDRLERHEDENRSIGIILCAEKDQLKIELALEDFGKPIGVADYQLLVPREELQQVLQDEISAFNRKKLDRESKNEDADIEN